MGGKIKETVGNLTEKLIEKIIQLFEEAFYSQEVFVTDRKGEYALVYENQIEEINKKLRDVRSIINGLSDEVGKTEKETIKQINQYIDSVIGNLKNNNKIDIKQVLGILAQVTYSINQTTTQINIEEPTLKVKGRGLMGTVSTKNQGKIDKEKNLGGIMISTKEEKIKDNIGGDYAKLEEVLRIIENGMQGIKDITKENDVTKRDLKKGIKQIVSNNLDSLAEDIERNAQGLPGGLSGIRVTKRVSREGLYKLLSILAVSAGIATTAIVALPKQLGFKVAINTNDNTVEVTNIEEMHEIIKDIEIEAKEKFMAYTSAGDEAWAIYDEETLEELNMNVVEAPEAVARGERIKDIEELETKEEKIESIMKRYKKIKEIINNPPQEYKNAPKMPNASWINMEIELESVRIELLEYCKQISGETNEYLKIWNELNEEHIDMNDMTKEATDGHYEEIRINEEEIEDNNMTIDNAEIEIEKAKRKISFYERIKENPNIEKVKNIEDVTETIYKFLETDIGKKIGETKLFELLKTYDLNLFSAYTKLSINDSEQFLENYMLMENAYETYVEEFCNGKVQEVREMDYAQYYVQASGYMNTIGEKGFLYETGKALLEQNNINNNFYKEYGYRYVSEEQKFGKFRNLGKALGTIVNGQRRGEYEKVIEAIDNMEKEKQNENVIEEWIDNIF